jgi:hypothetical protein
MLPELAISSDRKWQENPAVSSKVFKDVAILKKSTIQFEKKFPANLQDSFFWDFHPATFDYR